MQVDVYSEETLTGEQQLTSRAFLTFVAIARDGARVPVPPLLLETDEERRGRRRGAGAARGAAAKERATGRSPAAQLTAFSLSTLCSRSMPTRYLLRNLWPTIPPSWKPSSALGALRLSTTTGKFV